MTQKISLTSYPLYPCSDPSGKLNFAGKAIIHADGVDFSNGNSFKIKMDELELKEELGKGQYGTVQKVRSPQCLRLP
jgi:hypothetical protein